MSFFNANPGIIFQQDGARPHTARATINHLNNQNVNILPWLSKSADLNPNEHIWNELDKRLKNRAVQPRKRTDLRANLTIRIAEVSTIIPNPAPGVAARPA